MRVIDIWEWRIVIPRLSWIISFLGLRHFSLHSQSPVATEKWLLGINLLIDSQRFACFLFFFFILFFQSFMFFNFWVISNKFLDFFQLQALVGFEKTIKHLDEHLVEIGTKVSKQSQSCFLLQTHLLFLSVHQANKWHSSGNHKA